MSSEAFLATDFTGCGAVSRSLSQNLARDTFYIGVIPQLFTFSFAQSRFRGSIPRLLTGEKQIRQEEKSVWLRGNEMCRWWGRTHRTQDGSDRSLNFKESSSGEGNCTALWLFPPYSVFHVGWWHQQCWAEWFELFPKELLIREDNKASLYVSRGGDILDFVSKYKESSSFWQCYCSYYNLQVLLMGWVIWQIFHNLAL